MATIRPFRTYVARTAAADCATSPAFPVVLVREPRVARRSGRLCDAQRVGASHLRPSLVELVKLGNHESGRGDQVRDGPREVTAARDPLLDRIQPTLPALHPLVRCQAVLEEVQASARPEHP